MINRELPTQGLPSKEESQFIFFLLDQIDRYAQKHCLPRNVLIGAISHLSQIVFCERTPFNVKEQCEEIDGFCNFLKSFAMKHAVIS